ncbi:2979_t:CDS:2, partial [Cetraspora pellucida]
GSKIEILEEHKLLLVLADKVLYSCPIEAFDLNDANMASNRLKKIITNASFYKSGICLGETLITIVRNSSLYSTIETLELFEQVVK